MSTNQYLYRKTVTESITFVGKPQEATRRNLISEGFTYDTKSRQWYRSNNDTAVMEETVAATNAA
ncbi:hypothetical protein [Limnoglobus roseus]|uniref:Uncharacterized protein n=1 Tax=Limnoglobus roseus TaxID=2598579 RepID=A0A5C1AM97_9BACT|nr:hypothetical protein [Limnoglobus roseus]QEL19293.1 hypothetical protein PX52LOC_06357 [Limnoglobus roseus]